MLNSLENENKLLKEENEKLKKELYLKTLENKQFLQILDSVKVNIYWKDKSGNYLGCNKSVLDNLGLNSRKDIIGRNDYENNFPWNKSAFAIQINDKKVIQECKTLEIEEEFITANNRVTTLLSTKSPLIDDQGKVYGITGISVDITDRKQMQNKIEQENKSLDLLYENQQVFFQQIIDCIDANIYWKDKKGRFLGINKKNLASLGLSLGDVIGKTDKELPVGQSFSKNIMSNDLRVIENGEHLVFEESYLVDGKNIGEFLSTKSPLKDKYGNIIGLIGISVNITNLKMLEKKVKLKNKELKKKDIIKTQFIENFSHDVKVPINALVGRTQLLKLIGQKERNEKFIEVATDTENSAMVLDTLFKQMQNIIIHEQFDNKIYSTTFNLFSLVEKEIEIAKASVPNHKNINIDFHSKEDLSFKVDTDHYKLSQIIRNLLSNAIKYTDEGNISIKTEIIQNIDDEVNFKFIVADTGIGIDKAHQDNIFKLFNRAGITSHDTNRHGMGIGLYIVKNNLDLLGGNINFESHIGQGSKFSIEIPLHKVT